MRKLTRLVKSEMLDSPCQHGRGGAAAQRILELSLPKDHWQVAMAKNLQGAAFLGLRGYKVAEPLLLASVGGLSGAALPGLEARGRGRLAELYIITGNYEEAKKFRSN